MKNRIKIDETAKSPIFDYHVFPALNERDSERRTGVQLLQWFLDPGFRRGDDTLTFYSFIKIASSFILIMLLFSTSALIAANNKVTVEIFYLPHPPALKVVDRVETLLRNHAISNIIKYNLDDKKNETEIKNHDMKGHTPVTIFINGKNQFQLDSQTVILTNFPKSDAFVPMFKGDWDYPQLDEILRRELQK